MGPLLPAWILALAAGLLVAPTAAQGKALAWRTLKLERSAPPKLVELPPETCARLFADPGPVARSPNAEALMRMVEGRVRRDARGAVEIDREGLAEKWTTVAPGVAAAVDWFHLGRHTQLVFFFRAREWWVASGEAWEAKQGDVHVRLLDANANGACWEPGDYVAWRGGAFRPIGVVATVDDGTLAGEVRLIGKNRVTSLQYRDLPRPEGLDEQQWLALRTANGLRNQHGLPPTAPWPEGNLGLLKHTQFLQLHAPNKAGSLLTYYGEAEGLAGRTPEGDDMSKTGCVVFLGEGMTAADHVQSTIVTTQSRDQVLAPGATRFAYGRTQRWSFFRMQATGPSGSRYAVLPGAGSTEVPTTCGNNWPFPRSFPDLYNRPRGVPISVHLPAAASADGFRLRPRSIALFALPGDREVPGFFFSVRDIHPDAPEDRFFFVPGTPLDPNRDYLAQIPVEAYRTGDGGAGMTVDVELLQWQFRTGK
jgi:hypothetical protein